MRRVLWIVSGLAAGAGVVDLFSAVDRPAAWVGTGLGIALVAAATLSAFRGRGAVPKGVRAPRLAMAGIAVSALSALAGLVLLWRPTSGAGLPVVSSLVCFLAAGALFVPVGLMGDDPERSR